MSAPLLLNSTHLEDLSSALAALSRIAREFHVFVDGRVVYQEPGEPYDLGLRVSYFNDTECRIDDQVGG